MRECCTAGSWTAFRGFQQNVFGNEDLRIGDATRLKADNLVLGFWLACPCTGVNRYTQTPILLLGRRALIKPFPQMQNLASIQQFRLSKTNQNQKSPYKNLTIATIPHGFQPLIQPPQKAHKPFFISPFHSESPHVALPAHSFSLSITVERESGKGDLMLGDLRLHNVGQYSLSLCLHFFFFLQNRWVDLSNLRSVVEISRPSSVFLAFIGR